MTPLLSICIPTYNRCAILRQALENLVNLPTFSESPAIEIVISDNASPDETELVGREFARRYPDRIRYFRNESNVRDKNFHLALTRGNGEFLKLANDTLLITDLGLREMLATVRAHRANKPLLYFRCLDETSPEQACHSFDDFIREVGFMATWIAEFGIWKSDLTTLPDFARASALQLVQADVTFRMMASKQSAIVLRRRFFSQIPLPSLGGYSAGVVFGQNYQKILEPYLRNGMIRKATHDADLMKVFRYPILGNYLVTSPRFHFPKSDYLTSLWTIYKFKWYFWAALPFALAAMIIAPLRRVIHV